MLHHIRNAALVAIGATVGALMLGLAALSAAALLGLAALGVAARGLPTARAARARREHPGPASAERRLGEIIEGEWTVTEPRSPQAWRSR